MFQHALGERVAVFKKKYRDVVNAVVGDSLTPDEQEALVSDYFQGYVDAGSWRWRYAVEHPIVSLRALYHFLQLPRLVAELSTSPGGQAIWDGLGRERPVVETPIHRAASVLALPERPGEYSQGRRRQTLRRKCREAEKRGVQWRLITDPAERRRLVNLADMRDRAHPRDEYRVTEGSRRHLLVHPLMLAGFADDDRPILVSITPTDGQWAILQYFRTLEDTPEASAARYLLSEALAEALVARGVRYLADNASPMGINNGLRHFQRMLGFRIFRVDRLRAQHTPADLRPLRPDQRVTVTDDRRTAPAPQHSDRVPRSA